jgi:6-phosphogluconolactonase
MDQRKLLASILRPATAVILSLCVAMQVPRGSAQSSAAGKADVTFAYVSSFATEKRKAGGDGIHVYRADAATGAWTHVQHIGELTNPSLLALSPNRHFLYAVHGDGDYATAFALDRETGQAQVRNRAATGGSNGVAQAVDPSGTFLVIANYASGSVAVLAIAPNGSLKDQHQLLALPGEPGPHKLEQASSHPHDVVFDPTGKFVLVPDKGLDRIFVYRFDAACGQLSPADPGSVAARPGAGPRHLAFHPKLQTVWALNELDNTIATYRWDPARGVLTPLQVITTLPTEFTGYSATAEIAVTPDGRFVYCSNRGHDSVTLYSTNPTSGVLTPICWQPTQGRGPRFIAHDPTGRFLHVANEQGDTVVTFRVDTSSGFLVPTGQVIKNGSPVTIVFAARQ